MVRVDNHIVEQRACDLKDSGADGMAISSQHGLTPINFQALEYASSGGAIQHKVPARQKAARCLPILDRSMTSRSLSPPVREKIVVEVINRGL